MTKNKIRYTGTALDILIRRGTNPWVEIDGEPVDWTTRTDVSAANDCDQCAESPVAGAIPAMDSPDGIQRCDLCERFPGDLDAALTLALAVGGEVWFEPQPKGATREH